MPFDRAAYMREYRSAVRDGKATNIRGGMSRKDSPSPSSDTKAPSAKKETPKTEAPETDANPWVSFGVLLFIVVVVVAVFYFNSRGNGQGKDDEETDWRGR